LPFELGSQSRGTLVVYLDQSEQAKVLSNYFGVIAAIILLLLCVGIATPVAFAWMKSRERRLAEEQVRYLENHDAVTGLSNRAAFSERLADAMSRMHRDGTHIAVLCLDIDKLKEINDAVEHSGGDKVLRAIGVRMRATLREGDLIARLAAMSSPLRLSTSPISAT
jgi:predicted signal transduction protein with EAL and GGDEF domain